MTIVAYHWAIEKWVEANCECGIDKYGNWNKKIFEEFGCGCRDDIHKNPVQHDTRVLDFSQLVGNVPADINRCTQTKQEDLCSK